MLMSKWFYHLPLYFPLSPYSRKRLKAEIAERMSVERVITTEVATPSPIWLQNFPNNVHVFIHSSSVCPYLENTADWTEAATAAILKYANIWRIKSLTLQTKPMHTTSIPTSLPKIHQVSSSLIRQMQNATSFYQCSYFTSKKSQHLYISVVLVAVVCVNKCKMLIKRILASPKKLLHSHFASQQTCSNPTNNVQVLSTT